VTRSDVGQVPGVSAAWFAGAVLYRL